MKRIHCLLLIACTIAPLVEGGENGKGIRSIGLAGVRAMLPGDPWALVHNPAALARQPEIRISAFMMPALFGIKELRTIALCGSFSLAGEKVACGVEQFGFDLYRELSGTIGFGKVLANDLSAGFALEWRRTAIKGYGMSDALVVSAGWIVEVAEGLHMGFSGDNILGETIGVNREPLPQRAAMGISFEPLSYALFVLEGEKDIRHALTAKAALEIRLLDILSLRSGISHDPDIVSAGLSVRYETAEFGYAACGHAQLGWTHQIEVSVRLGE